MVEQTSFFELIKYEKERAGNGDFNGPESPLSVPLQTEYLDVFGKAYAAHVGADLKQKVIDERECERYKRLIPYPRNAFRDRLEITEAEFFLSDKKKYKYLYLYTGKTKVVGERIVMEAGDCPPTPAFDVETAEGVAEAELVFTVSGDYYTPVRGRIDTISVGKTIEFRRGITELIKLQLYPSGDFCVRLNYPDPYHHKNVFLGKFLFDENNFLSIKTDGKSFSIKLNDGETASFRLPVEAYPDIVFVGGGLHPVGTFTVGGDFYTPDGSRIDLFALNEEKEKTESLGEKSLPFCVGTYENRRKTLVLRKRFSYTADGKRAFLCASSLDPCGKIILNGRKISDDGLFTAKRLDVTKYLKRGENELVLEVEPRAPENVVTWHRHKDPYFGWFVGKIYLEKVSRAFIESAKIVVLRTSPEIVFECRLKISGNASDSFAEVFVKDGEKQIKAGVGKTRIECAFDGVAWEPGSPRLYDVTVRLYGEGECLDEYTEVTGFRTIGQKDGAMLLNGKDFIAKGALIMQYLPPYDEVAVNHVCPSDEQIVSQALIAKRMNCNCVRLHHLGFGTNDERFARIFDYFGITLIWTTRLIDNLYTGIFDGKWKGKKYYRRQMLEVINHPSIIMWEGANELYLTRRDVDVLYREFVGGVKRVDKTRLITPVSHLYYANDSYNLGCQYYQDDGKRDEYFRPVVSAKEWNDPLVVRSAHTYIWLLGYGTDWSRLRKQSWSAQPEMLDSKKHAYLVSEYAVIGRQNPHVKEAETYFNPDSYETSDEYGLGYRFENDWFLSQSYQALAAKYATKKLLEIGADGMLWCSLQGGANDGGYLKPPVDFYAYPKLAFYALREAFEEQVCFSSGTNVVWGEKDELVPVVVCRPDMRRRAVNVTVKTEDDEEVFRTRINGILCDRRIVRLDGIKIAFPKDGYYKIIYGIEDDDENGK